MTHKSPIAATISARPSDSEVVFTTHTLRYAAASIMTYKVYAIFEVEDKAFRYCRDNLSDGVILDLLTGTYYTP